MFSQVFLGVFCHSPTQPKLNSTGVGLTSLLPSHPPHPPKTTNLQSLRNRASRQGPPSLRNPFAQPLQPICRASATNFQSLNNNLDLINKRLLVNTFNQSTQINLIGCGIIVVTAQLNLKSTQLELV